MKLKISQLKAIARDSLRGKYGVVVSSLLLYNLLYLLINSLTGMLFQNDSTLTFIVSWLFTFIISLIMCIFTAGMDYMYLNVARRKETRPSNMLYMFSQHPDRAIIAGFVIVLLNNIASLPLTLLLWFKPQVIDGSIENLQLLLGVLLLSLILTVLFNLPFTFTYYFLVDSPEIGAGEALKCSIQMTFKNLGRILRLYLSFLGLVIVSVCTLYIGLLWVIPYAKTSITLLYMECRGELYLVDSDSEA